MALPKYDFGDTLTAVLDKNVMEKGLLFHERDRRRVAHMFKQKARNLSFDEAHTRDEEVMLNRFEPDWTKFENIYARDLLPSPGGGKMTASFLTEMVDILIDYVKKQNDRSTKVLDFHKPETLKDMMGHCLNLTEEPQPLEQILSDCKETLKYCVKTAHPRFFNQLSTGLDMIALSGEWLTATANTNMFTYEIAPVFTLMEEIVLTKMRECVGWPDGQGDGIFAPGGAISNLYAVLCARQKCLPDVKSKGLCSMPRLVMYTSDHAHFSIKRAGAILGIGTENVILLKTDSRGKVLISDLEAKIEQTMAEGGVPFFVSAGAGTTVLGAFDDLHAIADVCTRHAIWMHVDAAWGGGALVSEQYRHLLHGIERADSVTWNPHKLMGCVMQNSAILLKEKGWLEQANSLKANYLFQSDKNYDVAYDTGDKAIQCGRHNDVFKLWLMWRANGDTGFESRINRLMELSKHLQYRLTEKEGFEFLLRDPEFINVCFWYIPKKLRSVPSGARKTALLHKIAPNIKASMMIKGSTMVGYQPLGDHPNFFRMITSNPASTFEDIDFLLQEIERLGESIDMDRLEKDIQET